MQLNNFEHSDNLIVSLSNSSCPKHNFNTELSDRQADFAEIPSAYQLYWEAYQAQETFLSKGKVTEQEFLAVKSNFDDANLSSASIFENGLGGLA